MKNNYLILLLLSVLSASAQNIDFADENFKEALLRTAPGPDFLYLAKDANQNQIAIDADGNGEITIPEAQAVYELYLILQTDMIPDDVPVYYDMGGIEHFSNLRTLNCSGHPVGTLDLSAFTFLEKLDCAQMQLSELDFTGLTNLKELRCNHNEIWNLDVSLLPQLEVLICGTNYFSSLDVSSLTNLKHLNVNSSSNLTGLNLQGLSNLEELHFSFCTIAGVSLESQANLKILSCRSGGVTTLNLAGAPQLEEIDCFNNNITEIDLSAVPNLKYIQCGQNPITSLDLSHPNNLEALSANECTLTTADLSGCAALTTLDLTYNQLTAIDVSDTPGFEYFAVNNNNLETINLKNGAVDQIVRIHQNPGLQYICVDEEELEHTLLSLELPVNSSLNCEVNTYCSFVPGGNAFQVGGSISFDAGNDGCDGNNIPVPGLVLAIAGESGAGTYIANNTGTYMLNVVPQPLTLTPVNPNPQYYSIEPQTATITVPDDQSSYTQNFCLTPFGTFNDVEISLVPLTPARPGFNASYRLIYTNSGTTTLNGQVTFIYSNLFTPFESAIPAPSTTNAQQLTWDYTALEPFETRYIDLTLNINPPVTMYPVNIGDDLSFTASATPIEGEETPADNNFTLVQTVVGSYDPNDKTCLEGERVSPEMAGEYVHYLIRFENTGNYFAQNIVVTDMIDPEKFDISTLMPMHGSHLYITRLNGNKAEFIFENIQLPGMPGDARHGYVMFKIKTLGSLQEFETFSNTAAIYFDYNAPVVTNTFITILSDIVLGTGEFTKALSLYPNPVKDYLHLNIAGETGSIRSVEIYNVMGQVVLTVPNTSGEEGINVSALASGSYFIKAQTGNGAAYARFIRE